MERYEKYKDSGVEWIGEIPEGWEVKKLARTVEKLTNGYVGPTRNIMRSAGIPYIQGIHIKNNTIRFTPIGNYYVDKEWSDKYNKSILKTDDLLVVQTGAIGDVGIVPEEFEGANCHALLIVRANKTTLFPKYFLYFLTSPFGYASLQQIKTGEILFHINGSKLKGVNVLVPALFEQTAIANYLDRKTAEIDELVAQKKRLLELYEEEKTTIINQAVTQGINSDVKLKDSGIDWLGEIPEHWEVTALKRLVTKITDGEHISPKFTQIGMPFLSAKDVRDGYVRLPNDKFVNYDDGLRFRIRCNPELNDILLVSRGATVGRVAIIDTDTVFCLLGSVILLKPKEEFLSTYFFYSLKNKLIQDNFLLASQSSAQQAIYLVDVATVFLAIPSFEEQTSIVRKIETQTTRINAKITQTKKIIALQKEYRTALISEVVTGKIKVTQGVIL